MLSEAENEEVSKRRRTSSDGRLRRGLNPRSGLDIRQSIDTPLFRSGSYQNVFQCRCLQCLGSQACRRIC